MDNLYQGLQKLIANHNIEVIEDEASFVDEHTIVLKNKKVTLLADYFILATGSKPKVLTFAQLSKKVCTSDQCFDYVPDTIENIVIVGGEVIGLELASFYRQLQHNVKIIEGLCL